MLRALREKFITGAASGTRINKVNNEQQPRQQNLLRKMQFSILKGNFTMSTNVDTDTSEVIQHGQQEILRQKETNKRNAKKT